MGDMQAGSQHISKWSRPISCLPLREGRYYSWKMGGKGWKVGV